MSSNLALNCLIWGQYFSQTFEIEIESNTRSIDSLIQTIRAKRPSILKDVDKEDIWVYKVQAEIPVDNDFEACRRFELAVWQARSNSDCQLQRRGGQMLCEIFPDEFNDKYLHIVVDFPQLASIASSEIALACVLQSGVNPLNHDIFVITIDRRRKVFDLRKTIVQEAPLQHGHRVLNWIPQLWPVSIAFDDHDAFKARFDEIDFHQEGLLHYEPLSVCFPIKPHDRHLQVIIEAPKAVEGAQACAHEHLKKRSHSSLDRDILEDVPLSKRLHSHLPSPCENLRRLHTLFWGVLKSPRFRKLKVAIPDIRTLEVGNLKSKLTFIELPDGINFPHGDSRLLIPPIYRTFSDLLATDAIEWQKALETPHPHTFPSHATIIRGQPGIGKTVFLSYLLVCRLQKQLVTVYCDNSRFAYVFSSDGVRAIFLEAHFRITELDLDDKSCALINLSDKLPKTPEQFYPRIRRGRVVIATPPNPAHLSNFSKEHIATQYCLPTWKWEDLYCSSLLYVGKLPPKKAGRTHTKLLRSAYTKFRGIPRICFYAFVPGVMDHHESRVQSAINNIESIEAFIRSVSGPMPFPDATSSMLVKIEPVDNQWTHTFTALLSDHIAEQVYSRMLLYDATSAKRSIKNLLSDPISRGYGGILFKQAVHRKFRSTNLSFRPQNINQSLRAPTLQININPFDNEAEGYFHSLAAVQAAHGSRAVHTKYHNRYLIPISKVKESIDAVWLSQDTTVLFQITVTPQHGLKAHGITEILNEIPYDAKKNIYYVFVVPADDPTTKNFRMQKITFPVGAPQKVRLNGYFQYVWYFKL